MTTDETTIETETVKDRVEHLGQVLKEVLEPLIDIEDGHGLWPSMKGYPERFTIHGRRDGVTISVMVTGQELVKEPDPPEGMESGA